MKYDVLREHQADRFYRAGDNREADPAIVGHLVCSGVLAEAQKAEVKPTKGKAAAPVDNKADQDAANKSGA